MKHYGLAAGLLLLVIASPGCKKIIDEIMKKPNGVASDCRVEKITNNVIVGSPDGNSSIIVPDTAYISYNAAGNPIRIRHAVNSNRTLIPEPYEQIPEVGSVFRYDKQNRIIAYLEGYYRDTVDKLDKTYRWHIYEYTGNNKITKYDYYNGYAAYSAGDDYNTIKNVPDSYNEEFDLFKRHYKLDQWGRIISVTYNNDNSPAKIFTYDASGNVMGDGFVYSDKIHYYQTNKVWMLLNEEFSVNMRTSPVDTYTYDIPNAFNSKKLPTGFDYFPHIVPSIFYIAEGYGSADENTIMHYKCR